MKIIVSDKIKEFLLKNSKTKTWLAKEMDVTLPMVTYWTQGCGMKLTNAVKLAEIMGVTINALVGEEYSNHLGIYKNADIVLSQIDSLKKLAVSVVNQINALESLYK